MGENCYCYFCYCRDSPRSAHVHILHQEIYHTQKTVSIYSLNLYHAEIYFFTTFQASKKNTVAFSKKLILALGERYKSVYCYVLCLNCIKTINEPPF